MQKAAFESIQPQKEQSFLMKSFGEESFSSPYHYHPEIELTLILKGEGKRYVGQNMSQYTVGDLVLLGENVPHCWKSENITKGKINASSIVIQFMKDCYGDSFFKGKELTLINRMLERSTYGICFLGESSKVARLRLIELEKKEPFQKMLAFLEILQLLASSDEFVLLNTETKAHQSSTDQTRINNVMAYIVDNFRQEVSLEKAASLLGLTVPAFCKFFKRHTRKTFVEVVTEYRINYAQQQLMYTDHPVSKISVGSGFGDVSHFYKTFRQKQQLSPLQYRNKVRKIVD